MSYIINKVKKRPSSAISKNSCSRNYEINSNNQSKINNNYNQPLKNEGSKKLNDSKDSFFDNAKNLKHNKNSSDQDCK